MPGFSGHAGRPVYRQPAVRPQLDPSIPPLLPKAQDLSITAVIALSRVTQANLLKLCTATHGESLAHQVNKLETVTAAALVSLLKQDQKILPTIGVAALVTYASIKVILRSFAVTVGTSLSLIRQVNKPYAVSVLAVVTLAKTVQKILGTIVAAVLVTLTSLKVIIRTFSVTVGTAFTRTTQAQTIRTVTVVAVATLTKAVRATRTTIAAVAALTLAKQDQAIRSATAGFSLSDVRQDQKLSAVSVTVQTTVGKAISAVRRLVATIVTTFTASGGTPVTTTRTRQIYLIGSVNTAPSLIAQSSTALSLAGQVNTTQDWTAAA